MLWEVVANKLCVVGCKPNDMTSNVFELDDEPQCTFQISKAEGTFWLWTILLLIPLSMLVWRIIWFFNLAIEQCNCCFLTSECYKCGTTLGSRIIASLKTQFQNKFFNRVLSQFDFSTTHQDLWNIMPNVRHAIMWCSQVWREMNL